ncbi:MAG: tRNA 2-selenouridine(34) synthase MnmH [Saprospiraceae bacterium]|nr:tRNA 2-selenouridine(34) synthase MnmH [Saprospiraceae bacterium]
MTIHFNLDSLPNNRKPIIDVRSPSEYSKGHIPNAINIPLFSDDERAIIGTLYKKQGKEVAIAKGLEMVGPRLNSYINLALDYSTEKQVILYCWRGGKRSSSLAWLLGMAGFDVELIHGGYKAYRNFILNKFLSTKFKFIILGGRTGSGKTSILNLLKKNNEQIIDLEALANHKGSAFGWIGEQLQPSVEHFENLLFFHLSNLNLSKRIWIENESRSIGKVYLPAGFWDQMKNSHLIQIDVEFSSRVSNLIKVYSHENPEELKQAFEKIKSKLGLEQYSKSLEFITNGDLISAAAIALKYYDKCYDFGFEHREESEKNSIDCHGLTEQQIVSKLIEYANQKINYGKS